MFYLILLPFGRLAEVAWRGLLSFSLPTGSLNVIARFELILPSFVLILASRSLLRRRLKRHRHSELVLVNAFAALCHLPLLFPCLLIIATGLLQPRFA